MKTPKKCRKLWNRLLALLLVVTLSVPSVYIPAKAEEVYSSKEAESSESVDVKEEQSKYASGITEDTLSAVEDETGLKEGELPPSEKEEALILSEVEDERDADQKTFRMDDGTYMVAQYSEPVHYQSEDKEWQEVDYSLEESDIGTEEEGYETTEKTGKEERIKFSKKLKEGKTISIKQTDYPISWGFAGAEKSTVIIENDDDSEAKEKKGYNERILSIDTKSQTLVYPDIYEGIDAEYQAGYSGIKENLILKEAGTQTEFEILYNIGNLTAAQIDEKLIHLKKADEIIYQIQAPYMVDAEGMYSDQLTIEIIEQKNQKLKVLLSVDEEWLKEETRVYPVVIDPVVQTKTEKSDIDSTFIASGKPNTNFSGKLELLVGRECSEYQTCRTLVKFKIPDLDAGNVVVDAQLNLLNWKTGFYSSNTPNLRVHAHQIEKSWEKNTVIWNDDIAYDDKVLDYDYIGATGSPQWRVFNVTEAVRNWYDDENSNHGILIKSYTETGDDKDLGVKAYFWPERYNNEDDAFPVLQIVYRNNKGLEDYWGYTTLSAGTAGTVHINDYTGNLVLVHEDAATSGNLVPVTLQHVYNSYQFGSQQKKPYPSDGKGWKMSLQQTLKSSSNYDLTGTAKTNYPYAYEDGDGTVHFFYKKTTSSSTKYLDEDGLDLRVTIQSSADTKTITDKKGNKLVFNYYGNLRYIKDASGNTATLAYKVYDDTDRVLYKVTDGAGHVILMNHNKDTYWLESITDVQGRTTTYKYANLGTLGDGYLSEITYPDTTSSKYTYDSDGALETAVSADGSKLKFYYTPKDEGKRVWKVKEIAADGTEGQTITFDRSEYNATTTRTSGQNDIFEDEDDLLTTYQFDNYGRTTGSLVRTQDEEYGGEIVTYTAGRINSSGSNIKQINKVSDNAYAGKNVVNYLKNHGGENSGNWEFVPEAVENIDYTGSQSTEQKRFGQKSLKITGQGTGVSEEGRYIQNVTGLVTGKTYTLSAYVKTNEVVKATGSEGEYGAFLSLRYKDSEGNLQKKESEYLRETTDINFEEGWRRISLTTEIPEGATEIQTGLHLKDASGTVYFDGIQLEEGNSYNAYNLFENAGFEVVDDGKPENWSISGYGSNDGLTTEETFNGTNAIKVKGVGSTAKYIYQQVPVSGTEDDIYVMSAWAKAEAIPDQSDDERHFNMYVRVYYTDGTDVLKTKRVEFNRDYNGWQKASAAFNLRDGKSEERIPKKISIGIHYSHQANLAYIDQAQVVKDMAESYTYDEDGNLITTEENGKKTSAMSYDDSGNLTSLKDAKNNLYKYTYNSKHQVTKAVAPMEQEVHLAYNNTLGLVTDTTVQDKGGTHKIKYGTTYTEASEDGIVKAGAYVLAQSDEDGKETTYDYDLQSGLLNFVTTSDNIKTEYTYDQNTDALTSVSQGDAGSVSYEYSALNSRLERIRHNGFDYSYCYDVFGNLTETKVAGDTISTNVYNNNNGKHISTIYGNEYQEDYVYDKSGALTVLKENGIETDKWNYDFSGILNEYRDLENEKTYRYDYDTTGRLAGIKVFANSGDGEIEKTSTYAVDYKYDDLNQLEQEHLESDGTELLSTYAYNKNKQPQMLTFDTGKAAEYKYDSLGRLTERSLNLDSPLKHSYSYYLSQRTGTSTETYETSRLKEESIGDKKYLYDYDQRGNITSIQEEIKTMVNEEEVTELKELCSYEYDSKNQLTRENNASQNKTIVYNYDIGGNMTSRMVYNYTTGKLDESLPEKTDTFTYEATWKDQLTKYNGVRIQYDAIGNPTDYLGKALTWKGRELIEHTENDVVSTYSYNVDGLRTKKTVGNETSEYYYSNGLLSHEKRGDKELFYTYDFDGNLARIRYINGNIDTNYYSAVNSRGDVEALYDTAGAVVARYTYDSWGKLLKVEDANGQELGADDADHIGLVNPIRYRGYYYDAESGFYYVSSRYYDPEAHRFISADTTDILDVSSDLYDKNLYAYCDNNPVMRMDSDGEFWNVAAGAAIGGILSVVAQVAGNAFAGESLGNGVLMAAVTGAASGALSATGLGKWGQAFANAGISLAAETINQLKSGTINTANGRTAIAKATIAGFAGGAIGGDGMRHKSGDYYKAARSAKKTAEKVFSKTYASPKTPTKLINRAANTVKKVGLWESFKTGVKFVFGSANAQVVTRSNWKFL